MSLGIIFDETKEAIAVFMKNLISLIKGLISVQCCLDEDSHQFSKGVVFSSVQDGNAYYYFFIYYFI
jgi:hypothetical protein